jgi:hypothetical protein
LLDVREVASQAVVGSGVALALRPLKKSLAIAVGKVAHNIAIAQQLLNKDGPRAEFNRACEFQFGKLMTPRLESRMHLMYHKKYGPTETAGAALFTSKNHQRNERNGRPRKKRPDRTGQANDPKETPREVVLQAAALKSTREKKKARAPVAHQEKDEEQDTALPMANADAYAALVQMPQTGTIEEGNDCVHAWCGLTGIQNVGVVQL